jgi:hypothetical protein
MPSIDILFELFFPLGIPLFRYFIFHIYEIKGASNKTRLWVTTLFFKTLLSDKKEAKLMASLDES